MLSLRLLTNLLVLLLPAVGFALVLPTVGYAHCLACCWPCSFASVHHLSPAVGYPLLVDLTFRHIDVCFLLLLRLCGSVCACPPHLLFCSPELGPLSIVVHRPSSSCCVRQSGVATFLLLVTTGAVGRGSFSVLCLNSLAAHRDLCHQCAARRLLRTARSSSVTLWWFTTPWFASALLQRHHSALRHFVSVGSR